jgi:hypothetical protein
MFFFGIIALHVAVPKTPLLSVAQSAYAHKAVFIALSYPLLFGRSVQADRNCFSVGGVLQNVNGMRCMHRALE